MFLPAIDHRIYNSYWDFSCFVHSVLCHSDLLLETHSSGQLSFDVFVQSEWDINHVKVNAVSPNADPKWISIKSCVYFVFARDIVCPAQRESAITDVQERMSSHSHVLHWRKSQVELNNHVLLGQGHFPALPHHKNWSISAHIVYRRANALL